MHRSPSRLCYKSPLCHSVPVQTRKALVSVDRQQHVGQVQRRGREGGRGRVQVPVAAAADVGQRARRRGGRHPAAELPGAAAPSLFAHSVWDTLPQTNSRKIEIERDASACIWRHQAFAVALVRERRFCMYKEAPGFRLGPRERETLPRV